MGTNYYLHLGKRIGRGAGRGCAFQWAVPKSVNLGALGGDITVLDEYGGEMSLEDFLNEVVKFDDDNYEAVGQRFS